MIVVESGPENKMRYYLIFLFIFHFIDAQAAPPARIPIGVTVACTENPHCYFSGRGIYLHITLKNEQDFAMNLPLEFIARTGPFIRLINNKNGRFAAVGTGIPDVNLRAKLTPLKPGESFTFTWAISRGEIEQLETDPVDLSAVVTLVNLEQKTDTASRTNYLGKTVFQIVQAP